MRYQAVCTPIRSAAERAGEVGLAEAAGTLAWRSLSCDDAQLHEDHKVKRAKLDAPHLADRHGVQAAAEQARAAAMARGDDDEDEHVPSFVGEVVRAVSGGNSVAERLHSKQGKYSQRGESAENGFMRR